MKEKHLARDLEKKRKGPKFKQRSHMKMQKAQWGALKGEKHET
jgi:hypothetical protein